MKTFLKVVLLLIVVVIAVKFLQLIFGLGWLFAAAVIGALAFTASAVVAVTGSFFVIALILSPIWLPMLALVGLIALIKRSNRRNGGLAA